MRFLPANKILGNLDYNFTFLKFFKEINKYGILIKFIGNYYSDQKFEIYWKKEFLIFLGLEFLIKNLEHSGNISNYWNLKQKNVTKIFQFRAIFFHINEILVKYLPSFVKFWLESFQILFL